MNTKQQSYANKVNARFRNKASNYVNLKKRFNDSLASYPLDVQATLRSKLDAAIRAFRRRFPKAKSFNEPGFRLSKAYQIALESIFIDTTLQRDLDINWVCDIIEKFNPWQAQAIQVYEPPEYAEGTDEIYASWDSQHTAVALWIIATMILKLDPSEVIVPASICYIGNKAQIRENFICGNSSKGKKLLNEKELAGQMIYGVRIDGSQDKEWVKVEHKQTFIEDAGLFFTHKDAFDCHQIGAITQVKNITAPDVPEKVVERFCWYAQRVITTQPRPINTKESPVIMAYLHMAHNAGIDYTREEMQSLADLCFSLFGADFSDQGNYWNQLEFAYKNWWERFYATVDPSLRPAHARVDKNIQQGTKFFWHQLKKSWLDDSGKPMRIPQYSGSATFVPSREELF